MKIKQLKAIAPLIQSFVIRAQTETRISSFRIRIQKVYNEKETQSEIWEIISHFFDKIIHQLDSFSIYCAFLTLNVFTISNTKKTDALGKAALNVGHPYIDMFLLFRGDRPKPEDILNHFKNIDPTLHLNICVELTGPDDLVKNRRSLSKALVSVYKKVQETTTLRFVEQFTKLSTGHMLVADDGFLSLCENLSENFAVHGLPLHVEALTTLPPSLMNVTLGDKNKDHKKYTKHKKSNTKNTTLVQVKKENADLGVTDDALLVDTFVTDDSLRVKEKEEPKNEKNETKNTLWFHSTDDQTT